MTAQRVADDCCDNRSDSRIRRCASISSRDCTDEAPYEPDASHELSVPSAYAGCAARSGAAGLRTIPLRRCATTCDPRVRSSQALRRPCGFTLCGCGAAGLGVADLLLAIGARNLVARTRRLSNATQWQLVFGRSRGGDRGNRLHALANDPSLQALPLHWDF